VVLVEHQTETLLPPAGGAVQPRVRRIDATPTSSRRLPGLRRRRRLAALDFSWNQGTERGIGRARVSGESFMPRPNQYGPNPSLEFNSPSHSAHGQRDDFSVAKRYAPLLKLAPI